ncbi:unnamed protein product [Linum tenue]|uniref:Cytochrome c oxidase subunit 5C n=2 Tax=Linum tenue TaxID=586396 RepID=A0AAV0IBT8_9ROSI|nr:unnamed protein product [Linum tenue]
MGNGSIYKSSGRIESNRVTQRASLVFFLPSSPEIPRRRRRSLKMAGRIPHPVLKGPSVMKEIVIGMALGLVAGGFWKMHHWNEQRKVRSFYDMLEKGEISVIAQE